MLKRNFAYWIVLAFLVFPQPSFAGSVFIYEKAKVDHPGKDITPLEAYAMIKKNPNHMIIVDVRTRAEYEYIGHPVGAYLVPIHFFSNSFTGKGYKLVDNENFGADIKKRFDAKTDTLFFLCRSGTRAAIALGTAVKAGWPADRAYVILGGFEGEKLKDDNSIFNGMRLGGGWRNEGLPWTYSMDQNLVY